MTYFDFWSFFENGIIVEIFRDVILHVLHVNQIFLHVIRNMELHAKKNYMSSRLRAGVAAVEDRGRRGEVAAPA